MGVDFYLLPKTPVNSDPVIARDWLNRETRLFGQIPNAIDPAIETRKRRLADLLLKMKPDFCEFNIRYDEIAQHEKISVEDARRKYRYIEVDGPGIQFTIFDQYVAVALHAKIDAEEFDAILAALSAQGRFVLFDPLSDTVFDLNEESFA